MKIVFKIEIETLFGQNGRVDPRKMEHLVMVAANIQNAGAMCIIVSSGAIAMGMELLNLQLPPSTVVKKQAIAATGQAQLIGQYQEYFEYYDQIVAQVLINSDIIDSPLQKLNASRTLTRLLEMGIIPVVNENDSISSTDIILKDNYQMAVKVAELTGSEFIILNRVDPNSFIAVKRGYNNPIAVTVDQLITLKFSSSFINNNNNNNKDSGFPDLADVLKLQQIEHYE